MLKKFIETVVKNKKVFYLEVDESFAMCGSQAFYIEESKEAIPVALFWEDEKQAAACKADEWAKGIVKSATLEEFIEICFGMQVETMAIGIGFNADLSGGEELVPVDLVKALVYEIERTKTAVTFSDSFESLAQVKQLLNQIELDITDEEAL
ncbi:DUF2750 domain-containing protein [Capnocytophaga sputigena]|jgi:hypothetical protein|uniref:DUF2750 domain-containing protein n=1 Tax=Capnocytophaga sputigena TaxID=1019 RepID=A0AAX2IF93_CAPSP|nr:DUF2750 domain-containing protein [Capnocytophaga sputigena]ATA83616.1 DUF2750 domain-containing protein [Capnocytophaga sputigena]EEB66222.1 hypothetical protein CAPSP0001_1329 [Capnocytophaga sputigena ATCC 33612]SQA76780.1 Protein of uncharacterised function (DUF2750) [Capnocytophaga sputigena]